MIFRRVTEYPKQGFAIEQAVPVEILDDRPTPFVIDRVLLVTPLLGVLGWVVWWLTAVVSGWPQPGEVGLMVGGALALAYWLAVTLGTLGFWLHDRRVRAARMRDAPGPFERNWADSTSAARPPGV